MKSLMTGALGSVVGGGVVALLGLALVVTPLNSELREEQLNRQHERELREAAVVGVARELRGHASLAGSVTRPIELELTGSALAYTFVRGAYELEGSLSATGAP
jgi:hypothetical protein